MPTCWFLVDAHMLGAIVAYCNNNNKNSRHLSTAPSFKPHSSWLQRPSIWRHVYIYISCVNGILLSNSNTCEYSTHFWKGVTQKLSQFHSQYLNSLPPGSESNCLTTRPPCFTKSDQQHVAFIRFHHYLPYITIIYYLFSYFPAGLSI